MTFQANFNLDRIGQAMGLVKKPEPESSSLTRGLWRGFGRAVSYIKPTNSRVLNALPQAIVAAILIAPTIILTAGTIVADAIAMTARGISNAYKALRNKFTPVEPGKLEKAVDFAKANKKAIAAGSLALVAAGGGYVYRNEISGGISAGWEYTISALSSAKDRISSYFSKDPA